MPPKKKKAKEGDGLFPLRGGQSLKSVVTVDPGIRGSGFAYWERLYRTEPGEVMAPRDIQLAVPKAKGSWQLRAGLVVERFKGFLYKHSPGLVVIELPEVWSDSEKSMASATKGDLIKLAVLCGRLEEATFEDNVTLTKTLYISPQQWKGQLSKRVVDKRIKASLQAEYPDHVSDAVGMGLSMQGWLG